MSSTFDIFSIKTVPSTYSWDKGTPNLDFNDFITELSACSAVSNNEGAVEYVGYAPFVFVSLSSAPGNVSDNNLALRRVADFGDYYNSESNFITSPAFLNELFCHTYVMPGLYTIRLERTEYSEASAQTFSAFGNCFQKHCIDWSWKTLSNCTSELSVAWSSTITGARYEKKWKYEPCTEDWASVDGLYIQKVTEEERVPLSWQWYNFFCSSSANPHNVPVKWSESSFQQTEQLTWAGSSGPCISLEKTEQTIWKWNNITINVGQFNSEITWDQTSCSSPQNATWDHVMNNCVGSSAPVLSSSTQNIVKEALIRVLEIPPTAYLEVDQSPDRTSPLTVTLSPKSTLCGSFPIEKIVWDLGDGSPLLTQRRWSNTLEMPFVYSGALQEDYQDPRNYDVVHTYVKTIDSDFCFYPSITAYSSSTSTSDCAAITVGPIKFPSTNGENIKLLQNELTSHGKVLIGQVDDTLAVWKIKNR